jgi:FtsZ-interacting cell division protein ZipA
MLELRWILLGMGITFIAALYLWSRKPFFISVTSRSSEKKPQFIEPTIAGVRAQDVTDTNLSDGDWLAPIQNEASGAERIVTVRLMGRASDEIGSARAILALRAVGLVHGRYGIFHSVPNDETVESFFSVASLTEPGSFNVADLEDTTLLGMSFFMVLPGLGDPVVCFDAMIQAARALSKELDAELFDEQGSSWSIQRERYIREEIIEYRHQLGRV